MALHLPRIIAATLAVAVITCGIAGTALGESVSAPFKDWEVGPINVQSSNGVGYCSMKNFYEQGQALVFARDAEGSSSLAISFPGKLLVSGGQYTAGLRIGSMSRQAVGLAGTPSVLIVQLGFDRDVYKALQKEQTLSVTLKDKTFSFALDGTQEALDTLMICANTIAKGKKFKPVMVTAIKDVLGPDVVAPDSAQAPSIGHDVVERTLLDEIARLRLENRKLLRENQTAMGKLLEMGDMDAVPGINLEEEIERDKERAAQAAKEAQVRNRKLKAANESLQRQQVAAQEGVLLPNIEPATVKSAPAPVKAKPRTETARVKVRATAADAVIVVHKQESLLESLLKKAHISAKRDGDMYSWEEGSLYGGAEERGLTGGLRAAAAAYVEEARSRCPGDFAHNLGALRRLGDAEALEGELACLDGQNDAAAALVFVADKGKLAIIAHEGPTDTMGDALAQRDKVISDLSD